MLTPFGSGIAGIAAQALGNQVTVIFIISGIVAAAIALLLTRNRNYRNIMSTDFGLQGPRSGPRQPPAAEIPTVQ